MSSFAEHRIWAVTDSEGFLLHVYDGAPLAEAAACAVEDFGAVTIDTMYPDEYSEKRPALAANSRLPMMPAKSLKASTLEPVRERPVMTMDLDEAFERIGPYLPRVSPRGPVRVWRDRAYTVRHWLSWNAKTRKSAPGGKPLISRVLNLAPNALAFQDMDPSAAPRPGLPQGEQSRTLCAGANDFCRASCLAYSGQHAVSTYNMEPKLARTKALLEEPHAFMRMLAASIEYFIDKSDREGLEPCLRLNVLSDLPWELFAPWLYRRYPIQFYDYTKVFGRRTPANYDLTFSYSGTNWNQTRRELEQGRRAAVVFFAERKAARMLPERWHGYDVVNGDDHDFRFLDPGGVVVGLRYKTPGGTSPLTEVGRRSKARAAQNMIVPCWLEDGRVVAAETPRQSTEFGGAD